MISRRRSAESGGWDWLFVSMDCDTSLLPEGASFSRMTFVPERAMPGLIPLFDQLTHSRNALGRGEALATLFHSLAQIRAVTADELRDDSSATF